MVYEYLFYQNFTQFTSYEIYCLINSVLCILYASNVKYSNGPAHTLFRCQMHYALLHALLNLCEVCMHL